MHSLTGQCHCGSVTVIFQSPFAPEDLPLRACGCSFCRKHGARTTSTPGCALKIVAVDTASLRRYRFATGTADLLMCAQCGVYLGATMDADGKCYGVLNVNVLNDQTPFAREPQVISYDGEDTAGRIAVRIARWASAEIVTP